MLPHANKTYKIYLTNWQKRMIKDFLNADCDCWEVPINLSPGPDYGIRLPKNPSVKKMYLTNTQITELKNEIGVACNFVELELNQVHILYGAPRI